MIRRTLTIVLVLSLFFVTARVSSSEITIAWDDFEDINGTGGGGWTDNWAFGGYAEITDGGTVHTGQYHMRLRSNDGTAIRTADMSDYTNAHLTFWWKADKFESGDSANVQVNDGQWHTVLTVVDGQDDDIYHAADINLSGFNMVGGFQIRVSAYMDEIPDYFYIDDLEITGALSQYTISGTITCGNLDVNDVNLIGLGVLTDANGFYTASVDYGFSGTVTPVKYGYTFDPNIRSYVSVTSNLTAEDYNALPTDDFNDNRRSSMWRRNP